MILNNKRQCLENHYIYRMGCFNSKPHSKKRLKHNSNYNLNNNKSVEEDNFMFPKKRKRQRKRKREKKKQKKINEEKQQSILDTLLGRNKKEKTPLLKQPNTNNPDSPKRKRKTKIPLAMRQNVWVRHFGREFEHKCFVSWCPRIVTCFDFEVGHNIPECKGGKTDESNLFPICHKCNGGMGSRYTIEEWSNKKFFNEL